MYEHVEENRESIEIVRRMSESEKEHQTDLL